MDKYGFVHSEPNINLDVEFGCVDNVRFLSKDHISIYDTCGNKIESVECFSCKKNVDPRDCTYLMGAQSQAWICNTCQYGGGKND